MRLAVTIGIAALIFAAGAAGAQTAAPPAADALTPVQIVAVRKAAFDLSQNTFGGLNAQAQAATPDWRGLGFGAAALSRWAHALPTLFVAGTSATDLPGGTAAKPEIWTARADFEAKAAAYAAAADKLGELATAQDIEGYKTQLAAVNETCRSCHMVYRARPAG